MDDTEEACISKIIQKNLQGKMTSVTLSGETLYEQQKQQPMLHICWFSSHQFWLEKYYNAATFCSTGAKTAISRSTEDLSREIFKSHSFEKQREAGGQLTERERFPSACNGWDWVEAGSGRSQSIPHVSSRNSASWATPSPLHHGSVVLGNCSQVLGAGNWTQVLQSGTWAACPLNYIPAAHQWER